MPNANNDRQDNSKLENLRSKCFEQKVKTSNIMIDLASKRLDSTVKP